MNNLNTSNWIFFTLKDIFTIEKAKNITLDMAKESLGNEIPYITRTKFNNGANFFVQKENFKIEKGNCITIGGEGANVFYQPFDFISGNNTTKLYHDKLNENSGLFIISILNLEKYRYSYNRAWNKKCIENTKIKLPVDQYGDINWQFMEEYIRRLRNKEKESFELSKPKIIQSIFLNTSNWKWFKIEKIFQKNLEILKYPSEPEERGDIPFITSTSLNNGINSYVNVNKKISFDKECLTISTNGQCFDVFLQDYGKFCISSDVEILYNSNLKKYHLLFLATVIKKERYRWGYGRKPKNGKVFSTKIKLPVDQYGDINWQFMEEYIKSLPYSKYL